MRWSIRELSTNDLPAALGLWRRVGGLTLRDIDRIPALETYLERNRGLSFVAEAARIFPAPRGGASEPTPGHRASPG